MRVLNHSCDRTPSIARLGYRIPSSPKLWFYQPDYWASWSWCSPTVRAPMVFVAFHEVKTHGKQEISTKSSLFQSSYIDAETSESGILLPFVRVNSGIWQYGFYNLNCFVVLLLDRVWNLVWMARLEGNSQTQRHWTCTKWGHILYVRRLLYWGNVSLKMRERGKETYFCV